MYAKTVVTVALALLASSATAQTNTSSVDIGAIPGATKTTWCNAEFDSCNSLCGSPAQLPLANNCNDTTLVYNCTCANGSAPGLQYYIQTIPYFLCEQVYQNCIAANLQNASGQAECQANRQADCGSFNPANVTIASGGSSSTGSSPSATGSSASSGASNAASNTASPTSVSSSSSKGAAATMLALGRDYGSGVIAAGFAAAMML